MEEKNYKDHAWGSCHGICGGSLTRIMLAFAITVALLSVGVVIGFEAGRYRENSYSHYYGGRGGEFSRSYFDGRWSGGCGQDFQRFQDRGIQPDNPPVNFIPGSMMNTAPNGQAWPAGAPVPTPGQ